MTTYHVGAGGDFTTIAQVNAFSFSDDDIILFKAGGVWYEQLTVPHSYLTFGAYDTGDLPRIVGNDVVTGWTYDSGTGLYYKTYASLPYIVCRNGTLLINVATTGEVVGEGYWTYSGGRVYITDPTGDTLEVGARTYAINLNGKLYVTVEDLSIEGGTDSSLYGGGVTGNASILNNHIKNSRNGLNITTSGDNGIVSGNHIEHAYTNCVRVQASSASGWLFSDNEINDFGVLSAQILGSLKPQGFYINASTGCIIEKNHIHDGGWHSGSDHGIYVDSTSSLIIRQNHIHNCYAFGIKQNCSYGAMDNYQIHYNLIHDNAGGIHLYASNAAVTNAKIYNNVVYGNSTAYGAGNIGMGINCWNDTANNLQVDIKNNIIAQNYNGGAGDRQIYLQGTGTLNITSDYNLIWHNFTGSDVCTTPTGGKTWAEWNGLGFDTHGLTTNPLLVDPANGDYSLQVYSPCISEGVNVSLTADYFDRAVGDPPDIGFAEYFATNYYVDTASVGGNGTTTDLTGAYAAFKTVAAAQAALTGDKSDIGLWFKRGCTWSEQFTVGCSGTSGHPFTIGAYGSGALPILTGGDSRDHAIFISGKAHIIAEYLQAQHAVYSGVHIEAGSTGIEVRYVTTNNNGWCGVRSIDDGGINGSVWVHHCIAHHNLMYGGIQGKATSYTVEYNECYSNGTDNWRDHGIYVGGTGLTVRYNNVHDNVAHGIKVGSGVTDAQIYYNLSYNNGRSGLFVDDSCTGSSWYNNVSYGNMWGFTLYDIGGGCTVVNAKNNAIWGNTQYGRYRAGANGVFTHWTNNDCQQYQLGGGADTDPTGSDGNIKSDPLFNSDYSLQSGSPCINAGVDVSLTEDYLGNALVGLPDMGALEYSLGAFDAYLTLAVSVI